MSVVEKNFDLLFLGLWPQGVQSEIKSNAWLFQVYAHSCYYHISTAKVVHSCSSCISTFKSLQCNDFGLLLADDVKLGAGLDKEQYLSHQTMPIVQVTIDKYNSPEKTVQMEMYKYLNWKVCFCRIIASSWQFIYITLFTS